MGPVRYSGPMVLSLNLVAVVFGAVLALVMLGKFYSRTLRPLLGKPIGLGVAALLAGAIAWLALEHANARLQATTISQTDS